MIDIGNLSLKWQSQGDFLLQHVQKCFNCSNWPWHVSFLKWKDSLFRFKKPTLNRCGFTDDSVQNDYLLYYDYSLLLPGLAQVRHNQHHGNTLLCEKWHVIKVWLQIIIIKNMDVFFFYTKTFSSEYKTNLTK